ncbi:MAG: hypothetical protein L6416_10250 [Candidatus Omnitrophica bacterium]|nr:hypothetical protein [Candidatus Omnitrophota bacterium]
MKESTLRKLIFLLLVGVIISLLWAIGSNSRKKVELKKSETLESKLDKLIQANTAIVNDLKAARNRLAALQYSERLLKKSLAIETEKNEVMEKTIEKATSSALGTSKSIEELADDTAILKNTNTTLGEEILTLKEKEEALRLEIEKLKAELTQGQKNPYENKRGRKKNR